MIVISQNLTTNFFLMSNLQPDLSGALFFCVGKSPGKKKAGTEGGNSCPNYKNYLTVFDGSYR